MRRYYYIGIGIFALTICALFVAQTGQFITPYDYDAWRLVDDFDSCSNWAIVKDNDLPPSQPNNIRYYLDADNQNDQRYLMPSDNIMTLRRVLAGASFQLHGEPEILVNQVRRTGLPPGSPYSNRCLGVRVNFPQDTKMTVLVKPYQEIKLSGKVTYLRIWALGRGDGYNVYIWVRDYTGTLHILDVAKTDFIGWQLCVIPVPPIIPQDTFPYPEPKVIQIAGIAIANKGGEVAKTFYTYFDQLEVRSDTYLPWFDGQDIPDGW